MNKALVISISILLLSLFVKSQTSATLIDTTLNYKVQHDVTLDTATRVYDNIKVVKPKIKVEEQTYQELDKEAELNKIAPRIVAYRITPPSKSPLFKNYLRAGFGNYVTPYVDLYTMSGRSEDYQYGVHFKHRSSINGPVDGKNSGQSLNVGDVFVDYKLSDKLKFGGDVKYNRDMIHFYGYNQELYKEVDADSIKKVYNSIDVMLNTQYEFNDELSISPSLGYRTTSSTTDNKEADIKLGISSVYKLYDNKVGLDFDGYISQYDDVETYSRNFFKFKPYYQFNLSDFHFDFGMNLVFESDTLNGEKGSHFYPFFDFKYLVSEAIGLQLYGGLGGDMRRNTYQSFLKENLYLSDQLFINNTNELLNMYIGANSRLVDGLVLDLSMSYKSLRNLHYFVNSSFDRSRFDIIYDDKDVKLFDVDADLSYTFNKNLLIEWKNVFHSYSNFSPEKIIHRPNYEMDLITTYRLHDKVLIGLDAFYLGGLNAYDPEKLTFTKLDGIFDVSLNMEYRLNRRISGFAEINNLLSKQYQRYLFYKAKGINFLLGATVSF